MVTQNTLRVKENMGYKKINFKYVYAVDIKKCLKQLKLSVSICTSAPISELPFNLSTMIKSNAILELLSRA